ncbi:MAG: isoprenylcysteine carboxylmethyltransferase family protein [Sulfurovum sp.]|nr:isoprenylcysteine carboxylmethyltransferase family protein [Sulfurovum sp.]
MLKGLIFAYGIVSYIIGLIGQVWFILYISDWDVVTRHVNMPQQVDTWYAVAVDAALIVLFGLQHSGMARRGFKQFITRFIPEVSERSTYVLLSGLVFIVICLFYQPIDGFVWQVKEGMLYWLLQLGFVGGWALSVYASFIINHFELFGLQQVYYHLRGKTPQPIIFKEKQLYRYIRHPIQLGVLLGMWLTPVMSYGHLLLSVGFTIYIFIGLYFEEKDLVCELGEEYRAYKERVGMMFPKKRKKQ